MIKIENTEVIGWEAAIRGMRNPLSSWDKGDSYFDEQVDLSGAVYRHMDVIGDIKTSWMTFGENDIVLMKKLCNAGTDHRKFMRMITVYVDITAPLYWWKEFDTYKVGTVANSCSTMHTITNKEFELNDFSYEHLIEFDDEDSSDCSTGALGVLKYTIDMLNAYRQKYLHTKSKPMKEESKRKPLMKKYWWQIIQLLPSSYNQRRTIMLNYEVLASMYRSRKNHKLDEWQELCKWVESLPYSDLIVEKE